MLQRACVGKCACVCCYVCVLLALAQLALQDVSVANSKAVSFYKLVMFFQL